MKKLLYNCTFFIFSSIIVITGSTLQAGEYIDLPIIVIPLSTLYIIWLFVLINNKKQIADKL